MYYKQIIVVNKELNMSKGKMAAQVSHGSMAFLTKCIQRSTTKIANHQYPVWEYPIINLETGEREKRPQRYRRNDLDKWAEEARNKGEDYFYAKPIDPNNKYGPFELCEPDYYYNTEFIIDKDLYEQWMGGLFTKVILSAKNENEMNKIITKAKEAGMVENIDFFCIRDACLTELTPDETGSRWTCIGFRPMDASVIDPITKRLQLFKE